MSNDFDDIKNAIGLAVAKARQVNAAADEHATGMAKLLAGRLRHVSGHYAAVDALRVLKKELRDFNMTTGKWER